MKKIKVYYRADRGKFPYLARINRLWIEVDRDGKIRLAKDKRVAKLKRKISLDSLPDRVYESIIGFLVFVLYHRKIRLWL